MELVWPLQYCTITNVSNNSTTDTKGMSVATTQLYYYKCIQ